MKPHHLLHHRRSLKEDPASNLQDCMSSCKPDNPDSYYSCLDSCSDTYINYPPIESPPVSSSLPHHSNKAHKFLIITPTVFAVTFVVLACCILYFKIYLNRRASRRVSSSQPPRTDGEETRDAFLDEDDGPVVDHHIWYINTVGLQPSVISAITVCNYKRGDGLVEGTECSVCLNEFQEDETLRLLPKCNHAFHVPCIDTWLRSHTNCPMCRAPIVKNNNNNNTSAESSSSASASSSSTIPDSIPVDSAAGSGAQVEGATEREMEEGVVERRIEIEPIRRSVSLDSVSALKIIQGVRGNSSDAQMGKEKDPRRRIGSRRVSRTESLRRFVGSSSIARSLQLGPVSFKRSSSCSGKFLLPRSS